MIEGRSSPAKKNENMTAFHHSPVIECHVARYTFEGEEESGDGNIVTETRDGVLVAVIDALGHGPEAASARKVVISTIRKQAFTDLSKIIEQCGKSVLHNRGVVMSLMAINTTNGELLCASVGNITTIIIHQTGHTGSLSDGIVYIPPMAGIVGYLTREPNIFSAKLTADDLILFYTDGVRDDIREKIVINTKRLFEVPLSSVVEELFNSYCKRTDDALLMVLRYIGN